MPVHHVTAPDGSVYEVNAPEGASLDDSIAYVQKNAKTINPAGTMASVAAGAEKPIDNIVSAVNSVAPGVVGAVDKVGSFLGMPSAAASVAAHDATRARSATIPRTAGEIGATMLVPGGAGGKLAMAGTNAATGALLSDKHTAGGVAGDAALSAVVGEAGSRVIRGVSAAVAPKLSAGVQALRDANIPVTIGQALGGTARAIEDKAMSIPFVGDMIRSARDQGTLGFNSAVINRALAPISEALPKGMQAGHDAIKYAGDKLSDAYNALVPQLTATFDAPFVQGVKATGQAVKTLPDQVQQQFKSIITDALGNRSPGNTLTGQALKDAETKLTSLASRYGKSSDVDQQRMGDAIGDVRDHMRDMVMRQNPQQAPQLQALNQGWATLVQAEKAGASAGARDTGIFTPKQYMAAVAQTDSSVRGRAIARGTARNQDLAGAAADVLPSTVPDSGTAGRGALMTVMGAGGGGFAGHGLVGMTAGHAALGAAAIPLMAALPYTKLGQAATQRFIAPRGPVAQAIGQGLDAAANPIGRVSAAGVPALLRRPQ